MLVTSGGRGTCVHRIEPRLLKSYRVQDSPTMEYCCVYNVSSTQAEGAVAGLEKNAVCFSSHEARPLNNFVGAMPLEMFCLKILS